MRIKTLILWRATRINRTFCVFYLNSRSRAHLEQSYLISKKSNKINHLHTKTTKQVKKILRKPMHCNWIVKVKIIILESIIFLPFGRRKIEPWLQSWISTAAKSKSKVTEHQYWNGEFNHSASWTLSFLFYIFSRKQLIVITEVLVLRKLLLFLNISASSVSNLIRNIYTDIQIIMQVNNLTSIS